MIKRTIAAASLLLASLSGTAVAETVKVGMSGQYFPFTFVRQDKLQGFEVDVWNEIGSRTGLDVEFVTSNFSGLFGMLETGRIDTISNQITITDARLAKYDFAETYVYDGAQLVVRKGNDSIQGLDDLAGKKVAVNLGSNFEQLLRAYDTENTIDIRTYDTNIEQDVALGRIDAFVMDRVSTAQVIKQSGLPLQQAGEPFATIENAMPFLKTEQAAKLREQVSQALREMKADGTLRDISIKWFDADISSKS